MDIPAETHISALLRQGNVFYFEESAFASDEPHNFVLLNRQPSSEQGLVFVCATSKVEKVRHFRLHEPASTIVTVGLTEYEHFTKETVFDCNTYVVKSFADLVRLLKERRLKTRPHIGDGILKRLVKGVLDSRVVEPDIKRAIADETT